jgi:hypothetical protein
MSEQVVRVPGLKAIGPYSQASPILPTSRNSNACFAEFFPKDPPARMTMQVPHQKELLISIGCVALAKT